MERKDYERIIKKHPRFTLKKDLKLKQEDNILKYIAKDIVKNDIIAFSDETFSRNGKSGILIAKNGIYQDYKNTKIPFLNLQDVTYENKGKSSMNATFHYNDGQKLTCFMTVGENKDLFVEIIKEIANKYNHSSEEKKSLKVEEPKVIEEAKLEEPKVIEEAKKEEPKVVEETKKEEQVKEVSKQPKEREKSKVEKRLIEIYETQGLGAAYTPEVNELIEVFKEELDEDLFLDYYSLVIEKCESIKYFRYSEVHLIMADCYYYLNQYDQVMNCAKKVNLNVVDKKEYSNQLYNISYVLHEKEQYKEAYEFALAAVDGGSDEAQEIIDSVKENMDIPLSADATKKEVEPTILKKENVPPTKNKVEEKKEVKLSKETSKQEEAKTAIKPTIAKKEDISITKNKVEEKKDVKSIKEAPKQEEVVKKTINPNTKEKRIVIKQVRGLCATCEHCIRQCQSMGFDALYIVNGVVTINEKECINCQVCVDECRFGLIEFK